MSKHRRWLLIFKICQTLLMPLDLNRSSQETNPTMMIVIAKLIQEAIPRSPSTKKQVSQVMDFQDWWSQRSSSLSSLHFWPWASIIHIYISSKCIINSYNNSIKWMINRTPEASEVSRRSAPRRPTGDRRIMRVISQRITPPCSSIWVRSGTTGQQETWTQQNSFFVCALLVENLYNNHLHKVIKSINWIHSMFSSMSCIWGNILWHNLRISHCLTNCWLSCNSWRFVFFWQKLSFCLVFGSISGNS